MKNRERMAQDFKKQRVLEAKELNSLTGLHTTAFIRNVRLKSACRLIEEKKSLRISELAYAVSFNDAKYFSACFKKEFGMLPTDYIEKYNQKV